MKNTLINKATIKKIAIGLGELNQKVIYVGGATVSLYINDPGADDVRPTKDIDITIKVASILELDVSLLFCKSIKNIVLDRYFH